ncbi:MAG: hypothetical protein AAGB93_21635 [Planctomycetota bacterium]
MPNQGHARAVQAQAFGKSSGGGLLFRLAAIGLVLTGLTLAIVAVVTAAAPVATDPIRVLLDAMNRLGLDKGPAAFFGVAFFGLGLAILRGGGAGGGSRDAADAAAYASQTAGDVEDLTAIVATLQGELGSLRHEVGEARREIHESTQSADPSADGGNTASDPIFRLAASLDQLGARVDKRIDGARKEMLEAVEAMSETVQSATKEQTEAAREQRAEFEGLRMDMADLHAEVSRVGDDTADGESTHPTVGGSASLPRELSEAPAPLSMPNEGARSDAAQSTPVAPLPTPTPETRADAEFDFPSPPPPIPQPSEGLELLDDMEEDVARESDKTPPLFPDLDKKGF